MAKKHNFGKSDRTMVRDDGTVRLNFDIDSVDSFLEVAQAGRDNIDAGLPQHFFGDPDDYVKEDPSWSPMKFAEFKEALRKGDFSESLEKFDEAVSLSFAPLLDSETCHLVAERVKRRAGQFARSSSKLKLMFTSSNTKVSPSSRGAAGVTMVKVGPG